MTVDKTRSAAPLRAALALVAVVAAPGALAAVEISATYRVFEKSVKMKRIDATLYLSFADQTGRRDSLARPRRVECAVAAAGSRAELRARGRLDLRLVGRERGGAGAPWASSVLRAELDEEGRVSFEASELEKLVAEAQAAEAEIELLKIDYAGGKGKKVVALAVDCLREPAEE